MISAKVIEDSITNHGHRLSTIEFNAPRFILPQFNTHRVFSRNAGSSRAIPTLKLIEKAIEFPVMPIWNKNKPGMSGTTDGLTDEDIKLYEEIWIEGRDYAVKTAKKLADAGAHKQLVNRVLEPYLYFKGVVSATDWQNFLNLREHHAAQPEIAILAASIRQALENSSPVLLDDYQWHLPYVFGDERKLLIDTQIKISVARCARVSYRTFDDDKVSTVEKDTQLYEQLFTEKHLSPFEHQATPLREAQIAFGGFKSDLTGNFTGWNQFRKQIERG